jgi:hypothetical protein
MKPFIYLFPILLVLNLSSSWSQDKEAKHLLQEDFTAPLSAEWFWGLGTWKAENGILRGFESGERRHGPVKLRRLALTDATISYEFRLEGKAGFSSLPMNGSRERGHILNVVMSRNQFRIIAHIKKGESVDLVRETIVLRDQEWHPVQIQMLGETIKVDFNGQSWEASHPAARRESKLEQCLPFTSPLLTFQSLPPTEANRENHRMSTCHSLLCHNDIRSGEGFRLHQALHAA